MDKFKWDETKKEDIEPKEQSRFLDKEVGIDIKINPKKALKGMACIIIFLLIFGLGRWSSDCPSCLPDNPPEDSSGSTFSLMGFFSSFTGLFHTDDTTTAAESENNFSETELSPPEDTQPTENLEQAESDDQAQEEVAEETEEVEEETEEEVEEEVKEPVITTYYKVSFAIKNVRIDWRDIWGKITHLEYTIQNNEEGTIKPSYFIMTVEGYNEEASKKKVPLLDGSKEIRSKTSVSSAVAIPGGFNYCEKTAGSLDSVEIGLILFDDNSKPMASFKKNFDLRG